MEDATGSASAPEGILDNGEPRKKRTRLSCACVRCRQKKIRCDEKLPSCTPCEKAKVTCVVTKPSANSLVAPVRRKTGPGRGQKSLDGAGPHDSSESPQSPQTHQQDQRHAPAPRLAQPAPAAFAHLLQAAKEPHLGAVPQSHETVPTPHDAPAPASSAPRFADPGITYAIDHRRKFVGASSSQALLKWLDMESSGTRLSGRLGAGMSTTEEYVFPGLDMPEDHLPDNATLSRHIDNWFHLMNPAWPFLDEPSTRQLIQKPRAALDPVERALLYAIIAHSADADELIGAVSKEGERYMRLAWSSLPSLLSRPFRTSIQVILLICLALRNRSKDGLAWTMCAMAVRIGESFGLHLKGAGPLAALDARIWYSAYCIEKVTCLESGRPTSIDDRQCHVKPSAFGTSTCFAIEGFPHAVDIFTPYTTLCMQAETISAQLFSPPSFSFTPEEALRRIGERDAALTRWAETVPLELRPGDDPPTPNALLPYATSIHLLYHHLLICLHRLSLFDHVRIVIPELSKPAIRPYASRLSNSVSICVSSARSTLSALERVSKHYPTARGSWTLHAIFTAVIVLSIHTWQFPATWQARADLAMLEHATAFAAETYERARYPAEYIEILPKLFQKTKDRVDKPTQSSRAPSRSSSPAAVPGRSREPAAANIGSKTEEGDLQESHASASANNVAGNFAGLAAYLTGDEQFGSVVGWDGSLVQHDFGSLWPFLLGNGGFPTAPSLDGDHAGPMTARGGGNGFGGFTNLLNGATPQSLTSPAGEQEFAVPFSRVTAHGPLQLDLSLDADVGDDWY